MYFLAANQLKYSIQERKGKSVHLRTVPTIIIAHTFCASPDTWISILSPMLTNTGIFLRGLKLCIRRK